MLNIDSESTAAKIFTIFEQLPELSPKVAV